MIVSASYRTDLPAYYGAWFLRRLAAGHARVKNPYSGRLFEVDLAPDAVDGFVFWTRNPAPFDAGFEAVNRMGKPFVVQMTITGYDRGIEPGVLQIDAAVAAFRRIASAYGPEAIVWRYDPVLATDVMNNAWHARNVERLAQALQGATNECVFSFAHLYRKSLRNLEAARVGFREPPPDEKRALLRDLGAIVESFGMAPRLCAQPDLLSAPLDSARCIDADRLSRVAGRPVRAKRKGARKGCECSESRDIGRYDACPQGCAYCYANRSQAAAQATLARHKPTSGEL